MSLLAAAAVAAITQMHAPCPSPALEFPRVLCSALEVTGRVADGSLSLDPAFDVLVPPYEFIAGPPSPQAGATLEGFSADGRRVFAIPFVPYANFRVLVPLHPATLDTLAHVRATLGTHVAERFATQGLEPQIEAIEVDARHVVIGWDASRFPGLRVLDAKGRTFASADGRLTYEQLTVDWPAAVLDVRLSNGVRSVVRSLRVFGR